MPRCEGYVLPVVECFTETPQYLFMATRTRSSRRWLRLRRHVLRQGPLRVTLALAAGAGVLASVFSQGGWWLAGAPLNMGLALAVWAGVAGLVGAAVWPLMRMLNDLEAARVQLDVLATRDELTGIYNRRQFLVLADREWARCRRYDMGAALVMFDVDHFKRVNDLHGHLAGDLMLREIARAAAQTLRHADFLGRFGGEEFILFLPHTDVLGALDVAERIRERVAAIPA